MSARGAGPDAAGCATLAELLALRAGYPDCGRGFRFLAEAGEAGGQTLSFAALDARARALAATLLGHADPGDRVLLCYPAGLDFLVAFCAAVHAGLVAVPVPAPRGGAGPAADLAPLAAIVADCAPRLALTTAALLPAAAALPARGLLWLATDGPAPAAADALPAPPPSPSPDALAYLQYTSGSTAAAKGVMLSHRSVMANLAAIHRALDHPDDAVGVSWLPHFHDMGLAGGLLGALYGGFPFVFMPPAAFLARPMRWLQAMTRYRGTWSGGPNFAYELCCRHVRPRDLEALDLGAWRVAANGSEPVRGATIERFCATFAPAGFRREAMTPFYGLAETVVFATGAAAAAPPRMAAADGSRRYACCGAAAKGHRLAIVDPDTRRRVPPGGAGEIWLSGPSVGRGYWGRPEESKAVFRARLVGDRRGGWLRTGDTGFLDGGELAVMGRLKDLVIVAGVNHVPQDIEATVEAAHPAVRPGNAVAFGVEGETERLVVVAETAGAVAPAAAEAAIASIRSAVGARHGLAAAAVALVRGRTLPKTSSGKIRRAALRDAWSAGRIDAVAEWPGRSQPGDGEEIGAAPAQPFDAARLHARLIDHVRRIVGDGRLAIDVTAPIHRLGLGSLELAELKRALEAEFPVDIPFPRLVDGWSIADLVAALGRGAAGEGGGGSGRHRYETLVNPAIGALLRRFRLDQPFVQGEGAWLRRADGSRVLDAIAGFGALPLGHNPKPIWAALTAARDRGEPSLVRPSMSDAAAELAERLLAVAPPGLAHVTFTNSGAETTEAALKLVRAATGRRAFLSTRNGFHGKTLGALSVTGRPAVQQPFGAPIFDVAYVPYGDLAALETELDARGDLYAGFIVEPIQGEGGIVEPPAGYLAAAADLCRRHGVKLIVDEIQTGLGRTGTLFACAHEGIAPDVLLVAKALGGGLMPIGAMLYRSGCYTEDFARTHSSTFAENTLACRAGLAMLDCLAADDGRLVREVAERGARLGDALRRIAERWPGALRSVRGRGYLLGLELPGSRDAFPRDCLLGVLAEQGQLAALVASYLLNVAHVRVAPTLLSHSVVRIEPPLDMAEAEIDRIVAAVDGAAERLANADTAALVNHLLDRPRAGLRAGRRRASPARSPTAGLPRAADRRFAFLAHPVDAGSYADLDRALSGFTAAELGQLAERLDGGLDPFVAGETRIEGAGAAAHGRFIVVPHLATVLARERGRSLKAIREAADIACRGGAGVLGLGGYVSVATGGGLDLAGAGIPLTTGNSYTALAAADAVEAACDRLDLRLASATVGVVGAAGSVGRAVSLLMAERCGRLVLVGDPAHAGSSLRRLRETAEAVVGALLAREPEAAGEWARRAAALGARSAADPARLVDRLLLEGDLTLTVAVEEALAQCDVVLTATSSPDLSLPAAAFRHGAVACDLSQPRNLMPSLKRTRPDMLVIDGGLVAVPGRPDLGWGFGLPRGVAFACMCEPMILALEGRFDAAPKRFGIDPDYLRALRGWGRKHGFRLAGLRAFGRPIGDPDWSRLRAARRPRPAIRIAAETAREQPA